MFGPQVQRDGAVAATSRSDAAPLVVVGDARLFVTALLVPDS
ncbi:hypothetical protein [Streptomyces sp. NPDC088794]